MELRELHQKMIEAQGHDDFTVALGQADARLAQSPGDIYARIYKGAILTLIDSDLVSPAKRTEYVKIGAELVIDSVGEVHRFPKCQTELRCVAGTTLGSISNAMAFNEFAAEQLKLVIAAPDFDQLTTFEAVRALTIAAYVAEQADNAPDGRALFVKAVALDRPLAVKTYEDLQQHATSDAPVPSQLMKGLSQ